MMIDTRICLFCEQFYICPADPGYSDMTPGSDVTINCTKGYWEIDLYDDYVDKYREKLSGAKTCPDWEPCEMITEGT